MSTTISIRGRCAGSDPRLIRRLCSPGLRPLGGDASSACGTRHCRDLLDVFQTQQHLIFGQRLRPAAEAMALQFLDDLTQPLALASARRAASLSASRDRQAMRRSA